MKIAVLGAGPGGATAALALAHGGAEVTVHLPAGRTEKPCGGALPAYLLDGVSDPVLAAAPAVEVGRAVLENAAGSRLELPLDGLLVYRRRELDAGLLAAAVTAGARLCEGRVRRLETTGPVTLRGADGIARRYEWLVAADGALGPTRRELGLAPAAGSVGVGASLALPADAVPQGLVLGFPDVGDSYLWIFPRPGGVSVGIAYSGGRLSAGAAGACLDAFLERHLAATAGGARYRYPIPVYGERTLSDLRRAAARGVLLVGDAAGLADPLTREGIRPAMRAGQWAAEALLAGRPAEYPRRVADGLAADMARARRACRLFYDDRVGQWMVPVCRALPGVRRVLGDLLACRQPYRGLRRRLLASALRRPRCEMR
ncbi:MAG: NAD(P)/FAD-dependent oxidoreductase [Thermoanaerobaculia bacterium]